MFYLLLLLWAAACAWQDAQQKRINNGLTLSGIAIALAYLLLRQQTLTGSPPLQALAAVGVMLLLMLPGYMTAKVGAGDIKMLLGLALASNVFYILICILVAAVAMVLWVLLAPWVWRVCSSKLTARIPYLAPAYQRSLPYAPFLFLGVGVASAWQALG